MRIQHGSAAAVMLLAGLFPIAGCGSSAQSTAKPTPSASAGTDAAKRGNAGSVAAGTLIGLTGSTITVHTKEGDQSYQLADSVMVRLDGHSSTVNALTPGMHVSLFDTAPKKSKDGTSPSSTPVAGQTPDVVRIVARSSAPSASPSPSS